MVFFNFPQIILDFIGKANCPGVQPKDQLPIKLGTMQSASTSLLSPDSPSPSSLSSPSPPCFSWSDYGDHRCDSRFLASPPSDVDGNVALNVTSVALDEFVAWGHKDSNASIVREGRKTMVKATLISRNGPA